MFKRIDSTGEKMSGMPMSCMLVIIHESKLTIQRAHGLSQVYFAIGPNSFQLSAQTSKTLNNKATSITHVSLVVVMSGFAALFY